MIDDKVNNHGIPDHMCEMEIVNSQFKKSLQCFGVIPGTIIQHYFQNIWLFICEASKYFPVRNNVELSICKGINDILF